MALLDEHFNIFDKSVLQKTIGEVLVNLQMIKALIVPVLPIGHKTTDGFLDFLNFDFDEFQIIIEIGLNKGVECFWQVLIDEAGHVMSLHELLIHGLDPVDDGGGESGWGIVDLAGYF